MNSGSNFLEFVRLIVAGNLETVSNLIAADPALATTASNVGASRQNAEEFFFPDIRHYLYAGDTALHIAAAAFQRPMAMLLVANGADVSAKNRRGQQPLHYAADANRWEPDSG